MQWVIEIDAEMEPVAPDDMSADIREYLEALGATVKTVKTEIAPGRPVIKYWCTGCRQDQYTKLHDFAACQTKARFEEERQAAEEKRVERRCREIGEERREEFENLRGITTKYGDTMVRDLARVLYHDAGLPDTFSSSTMEHRYTLMIQAALPDYQGRA